jgi:transcriptional regulator with XRE-family HTH domain
MKDDLRAWDPFPPKQKWSGERLYWDDEFLESRERFKNLIRPPDIPETARKLGAKLRRTREAQGISIEQAAQGTFIKAQHLHAIEHGELELLPGGLYTRRFIELYARFLNFDLKAVQNALLPSNATVEALKDSFTAAVNYNPAPTSTKREAATKLPRLGELLVYYFLSAEERDAFLGDIEEIYADIEAKFGTTEAVIFFYMEILNSMSPLLARFAARIVYAFLDEMK